MKMKEFSNKKGEILMPETLKIIIAVISLGLLAYLAYGLYGIFTTKPDIEKAEANLNGLTQAIENYKGTEKNYLITGPKEWYVVFFKSGEMPDSCNNKNCLCFCKKKTKESCDQGICHGFNEDIELVTVALDNNIDLSEIPREVFILEENKVLKIYTEKSQIEHSRFLDEFLYIETTINGKSLRVYEEMINVIEGKSNHGVEDAAKRFFDSDFGERGWCLRYSKEGPTYKWNDIGNCENIDYKHDNVATALDKKRPYNNGVLKVQFYALRG